MIDGRPWEWVERADGYGSAHLRPEGLRSIVCRDWRPWWLYGTRCRTVPNPPEVKRCKGCAAVLKRRENG